MSYWIAGAVVVGALVNSSASNSAANKQAGAAKDAAQTQTDIFNKTFDAGQPYRDSGAAATARLRDLLGISDNTGADGFGSLTKSFTPADFLANKDPGYDFQLQQGQKALQNSQAANGGVLSGAALKELIGFNQGFASTGYQNAFDRWLNSNNATYSRLGNLASLGENSAVGAGNSGANFAGGIGNALIGAGNASAAGTIGQANAVTGAVNNGLGYYQLNQLLGPQKTTQPVGDLTLPSGGPAYGGGYGE